MSSSEIREAYEKVRSDKDDTTYLVLDYDGDKSDKLVLTETGTGVRLATLVVHLKDRFEVCPDHSDPGLSFRAGSRRAQVQVQERPRQLCLHPRRASPSRLSRTSPSPVCSYGRPNPQPGRNTRTMPSRSEKRFVAGGSQFENRLRCGDD